MKWKKTWQHGDKAKVARLAGISPSYLCDIMHGRRTCDPWLASRLSDACRELGYRISRMTWAFQDERKGNAFFPPYEEADHA